MPKLAEQVGRNKIFAGCGTVEKGLFESFNQPPPGDSQVKRNFRKRAGCPPHGRSVTLRYPQISANQKALHC
jgi:hypothetical protein